VLILQTGALSVYPNFAEVFSSSSALTDLTLLLLLLLQ
jgi:hypothetical protein